MMSIVDEKDQEDKKKIIIIDDEDDSEDSEESFDFASHRAKEKQERLVKEKQARLGKDQDSDNSDTEPEIVDVIPSKKKNTNKNLDDEIEMYPAFKTQMNKLNSQYIKTVYVALFLMIVLAPMFYATSTTSPFKAISTARRTH